MSGYLVETPVWARPIASPPLCSHELHIWRANLAQAQPILEQLRQTLSADETERVSRLRFDTHRHRAIASRGILRSILAGYLHRSPSQLQFRYCERGKPSLAMTEIPTTVVFNVTHSEHLALFAIADNNLLLGIDVEAYKSIPLLTSLVQRYCSPQEQEQIATQPLDQQTQAFFYYWTAKEALTKATGQGILDLAKVQIGLTSEGMSALYDHSPVALPWQVHLIAPDQGFTGAIAYAASERLSLKFFDWSISTIQLREDPM